MILPMSSALTKSFQLPCHLSAIVPVYNEEHLVRESLERLCAIRKSPTISRLTIIIVDDASTDESWARIRAFQMASRGLGKLHVLSIRHDRNRGKGAAIRTGVEHAGGEVTVCHDADLEYDPNDLLNMLAVFRAKDADAVFGSRVLAGSYRRVLHVHHELGNRCLTFACNLASKLNLTDMGTCYKMIRTDMFKDIPIESDRFTIEPELAMKLAKRDARIFEVPVRHAGRTYAEGKKRGWKDGVAASLAIVRFAVSDHVYREDPHGSHILVRMGRARRYNQWMADTLKPFVGSRVLEIGAGIGNLTRTMLPRRRYYATDINPSYLRRMISTFGDRPYVRVAYCNVTSPKLLPHPPGLFDTVICLNVMEHVKEDVAALKHISSVLSRDGRALVLVPNGPWMFSTLDQVLGHYRRYDRKTIQRAGEAAGLVVERILPFNKLGILAWIVNGLILRRRHFGLGQMWLLNALTPGLRVLDHILPVPPLSLIVVLRKPLRG